MIIINNKYPLVRVRYLLLALVLTVPVQLRALKNEAGFDFVNNKTSTTIPFELVDNLIIIPVVINDGMPVNLVLDTGVRSLVLFGNRFQKKLKIHPERTVPISGYGKKSSRKAKLSLDNDVSVSDIKGTGISMLITSNNGLFESDKKIKIEGLIGYQIFSRFAVAIDYVNKKIVITEPDETKYYEGFKELPLIVKDTKPYISTSLKTPNNNLAEAHFHIDTGSAMEMILFLREGKVELPSPQIRKGYVGHGLRGAINGYKINDINLEIADELYQITSAFMIKRELSDRELSAAIGTLGSGFLKDFIIVIDYPSQKFYFRKSFSGEDQQVGYLHRSDRMYYAIGCHDHLEQ